jgi:hypothetical protein
MPRVPDEKGRTVREDNPFTGIAERAESGERRGAGALPPADRYPSWAAGRLPTG